MTDQAHPPAFDLTPIAKAICCPGGCIGGVSSTQCIAYQVEGVARGATLAVIDQLIRRAPPDGRTLHQIIEQQSIEQWLADIGDELKTI